MKILPNNNEEILFNDLIALIEQTKSKIVRSTNSSLILLFWEIGFKINTFILDNKRADYGKSIIVTLSRQLEVKFGRNFEEKNLRRMLQFSSKFNEYDKVVTLSRHLSWSHFLKLLPLKNNEAQSYYADKVKEEIWSVRELKKQIELKSFERSEIAKSQFPLTKNDSTSVFKDPYFFDFLELNSGYLEYDLENSILKELENFIMELGKGFTFVERQKRMIIDGEDFYLDLLFYHRKLKRLVAIELKIGKFQAKFKGQMELYLKWLDKFEKQEGEEQPVGLILCAETNKEQIELLEMHKDGIMVAEYWTELPPKKELEKRLHAAMVAAKIKIENQKEIK
ncbi:MAG: YhcG family protein [Flavobacteriia bacterium]|jgi:predicted nuclease of restriction endonuclease-like (RecB) superfamily